MDVRSLATAFQEAVNSGDLDTAGSYLADNFQFSGPIPEPVGREEWLGLLRVLNTACPDIQYNLRIQRIEGNMVYATNQVSGTHTGDLDLSFMGMGVIPPTGKSFSNPLEESEAIWEDGKLVATHIYSSEGGGLMGMLTQLGINPAEM